MFGAEQTNTSKETCTCQKRRVHVNRDMYMWKETCTCEKRPIKVTYSLLSLSMIKVWRWAHKYVKREVYTWKETDTRNTLAVCIIKCVALRRQTCKDRLDMWKRRCICGKRSIKGDPLALCHREPMGLGRGKPNKVSLFGWIMSHIWVSHVSHMSESCLTYECVGFPYLAAKAEIMDGGWWNVWQRRDFSARIQI